MIAAAAPPAVVAQAPAPAVASTTGTILVNDVTRDYRVYRPASLAADKAAPLVVVFHGYLGNAERTERSYHWDAAADANGFEVAFPDGTDRSWNAAGCCGHAVRDNVDDAAFFEDLVAKLETAPQGAIDPKRIYVAGMSNGGMLAYHLACVSSVKIAAIGSVSGVMNDACAKPAQRPSVIEIHGLADHVVQYNGRPEFPTDPTVPKTIARWRAIDGCAAPATSKSGKLATAISACAGGRSVVLETIDGAGHQWPGSMPLSPEAKAALANVGITMDEPSTALDATTTLWTFFAAHAAQ